jgi:hypothetical protein
MRSGKRGRTGQGGAAWSALRFPCPLNIYDEPREL